MNPWWKNWGCCNQATVSKVYMVNACMHARMHAHTCTHTHSITQRVL